MNDVMYCPYCGIAHDDEKVADSIEHVIPYGLGGSDDLTIITCERPNNDLSSSVDGPFIDFFPVRIRRFSLGLKSTKRNEPTLDLGGTGWIDGKEVPISYLISSDTKQLKIAKPTIVRTPNPDGSEQWQISGDPTSVREIIEGKLHKQTRLGKTITRPDGSTLRQEDLDKLCVRDKTLNAIIVLWQPNLPSSTTQVRRAFSAY